VAPRATREPELSCRAAGRRDRAQQRPHRRPQRAYRDGNANDYRVRLLGNVRVKAEIDRRVEAYSRAAGIDSAGKDDRALDLIHYRKQFNGTTSYVEVATDWVPRTGAEGLYKVRTAKHDAVPEAPALTVRNGRPEPCTEAAE
jgi:hypothetical protein